jgi:hypothetical protein
LVFPNLLLLGNTNADSCTQRERKKNCHCTLNATEGKGFLSQIVKECSKLAIIFKLNPTLKHPQHRRNSWSFDKKNCKDTTVAMIRHCRMPCITDCRGRTATFMRPENMLLFRGGIRLLTNMETTMKKNCAFSNVAVKAL